jgi:hypothetical protein
LLEVGRSSEEDLEDPLSDSDTSDLSKVMFSVSSWSDILCDKNCAVERRNLKYNSKMVETVVHIANQRSVLKILAMLE